MNRPRKNNARRSAKGNALSAIERQQLSVLKDISVNTYSSLLAPRSFVPDPHPILLNRNRVYSFRRTANIGIISSGLGSPTFGNVTISLSNIPNSSDFINLFDAYRIVQITLDFLPSVYTPSNDSTLYTVVDPDDGSVPTTIDQLRQFDTLQMAPGGKFLTRTYTPHVADGVYNGTTIVAGGIGSPYSRWLDNAVNTIQHYGVKWAIDSTTAAAQVSWNLQATCVIQCRHPQ